jgi:cytochrome oxidase Cu insertion factor (SCO1/SenC/PrrC family)
MRPLIRATLLLAALLLSTAAVRAQDGAKAAPEDQTGLKVGEKAPMFVLKDQGGKDRTLDELLKNGKVALVFYRSADW